MTPSLCLFCRAPFTPAKFNGLGWYCSPGCASKDHEFGATWAEIGAEIGCTKQRAQQIAAEALRKIAPLLRECR